MDDPNWGTRIAIDPNTGYELAPGQFVLGHTRESLYLPHRSRIAARVEGKSSLARLGVGVHVTAPTIHAGFGHRSDVPEANRGSPIQLEIFHLGKIPVVLDAGMAICQLILEEVREMPERGYTGRFSDQTPFTLPPPEPRPPERQGRRRRRSGS
jgi:dCTP deaminase